MRSALEIANWFIENGADFKITHLKLQKLLYVAFGLHYTLHREALFYDQFEAWKYGPVLQNVYLHLKYSGRRIIKDPIEIFDEVPMATEPKVLDTLRLTLDQFGSNTASQLVAWTHAAGGPWDKAYDEKEKRSLRQIGQAEIIRWFAKYWKELQPAPRGDKQRISARRS